MPDLPEQVQHILRKDSIDIEIGAGQGLHAINYCAKNPNRQLIAIEHTKNKFEKLNNRRQQHPNLKNLLTLHANAISIISHYVVDGCIDHVFILYPNPYPKNKQANLRWHNMPFMGLLKNKLKKNATLTMSTNIESYASEASKVMVSEWGFTIKQFRIYNGLARTHFEKKYLALGHKCWNLVFHNN